MFKYEIDLDDVTKKLGRISGKQFDALVVEPVLKDMAEENAKEASTGSPKRTGALSRSFKASKVGGTWSVVSDRVYAPIQQWGWPGRFGANRFATKPLRVILGRKGMRTVENRIKKTFDF